MGEDRLAPFMTACKSNQALQDEIKSSGAKSGDDLAAIARRHGFELDGADFERYREQRVVEVDDADLEKVAGGGIFDGFSEHCSEICIPPPGGY